MKQFLTAVVLMYSCSSSAFKNEKTPVNSFINHETATIENPEKQGTEDAQETLDLYTIHNVYERLRQQKPTGTEQKRFTGEPCFTNDKLEIVKHCNNLEYSYFSINDTCYMYASSKNKNNYRYRFIVYDAKEALYTMAYVIDEDDQQSDSLKGIIVKDKQRKYQYFLCFNHSRNHENVPLAKAIMKTDSFLYPQQIITYKSPSNKNNPFIGKVVYSDDCSWRHFYEVDTSLTSAFMIYDRLPLKQIDQYLEKASFLSQKRKPIVNPSLSYMYFWMYRGQNSFTFPEK